MHWFKAVLILWPSLITVHCAIVQVDGTVSTPSTPCGVPARGETACSTLQAGLDAASPGDQVLVTPLPGGAAYTGAGNSALRPQGSVTLGRAPAVPGTTLVQVDLAGDPLLQLPSTTPADMDVSIEGLSFRNGGSTSITGWGALGGNNHTLTFTRCNFTLFSGFVLQVTSSVVSLTDCSISHNAAQLAPILLDHSDVVITDSDIHSNTGGLCGGVVLSTGAMMRFAGGSIHSNVGHEGGALYLSGGNFYGSGMRLFGNRALLGGALYSTSGGFHLTNSTVYSNSAAGSFDGSDGGFAAVEGGAVVLHNITAFANHAVSQGGFLYMSGGQVDIYNSEFYDNSAGTGGVFGSTCNNLEACALNITACRFHHNTAYYDPKVSGYWAAGALQLKRNINAIVRASHFHSNVALQGAGAVQVIGSRKHTAQAVFVGCIFENNTAQMGHAGAVAVEEDTKSVHFERCHFTNNRAGTDGGALVATGPFFSSPEPLLALDCTFVNNTALGGDGGAFYTNTGDHDHGDFTVALNYRMVLRGCVFQGNRARDSGGAIHSSFVRVDVTGGVTMIHNSAGQSGGAVHVKFADLQAANGEVHSNRAEVNGGAIALEGGRLVIMNTVMRPSVTELNVVNNTAGQLGGGIYVVRDALDSRCFVANGYRSGTYDPSVLLMANNSAAIAGGGLYSTAFTVSACAWTPHTHNKVQIFYRSNEVRSGYGTQRATDIAAVRLSDGSTIPRALPPDQSLELQLYAFDVFGQRVSLPSDLPLSLQRSITLNQISGAGKVVGAVSFPVIRGGANVSGVRLQSMPHPPHRVLLAIDCPGSQATFSPMQFSVNTSVCSSGYAWTQQNDFFDCLPCAAGFYILRSASGTTSDACLPCPAGARCAGRDSVSVVSGWWGATDAATGHIVSRECPPGFCCPQDVCSVPVRALPSSTSGSAATCVPGRVGVLCGSCGPGHVISPGIFQCIPSSQCSTSHVALSWIVGLVATGFFAAYLLRPLHEQDLEADMQQELQSSHDKQASASLWTELMSEDVGVVVAPFVFFFQTVDVVCPHVFTWSAVASALGQVVNAGGQLLSAARGSGSQTGEAGLGFWCLFPVRGSLAAIEGRLYSLLLVVGATTLWVLLLYWCHRYRRQHGVPGKVFVRLLGDNNSLEHEPQDSSADADYQLMTDSQAASDAPASYAAANSPHRRLVRGVLRQCLFLFSSALKFAASTFVPAYVLGATVPWYAGDASYDSAGFVLLCLVAGLLVAGSLLFIRTVFVSTRQRSAHRSTDAQQVFSAGYRESRRWWRAVRLAMRVGLILVAISFHQSDMSAAWRSIALIIALTLCGVAQAHYRPYRLRAMNLLETIMFLCLLLTVALTFHTHDAGLVLDRQQASHATQAVVVAFVAVLALVLVGRFCGVVLRKWTACLSVGL